MYISKLDRDNADFGGVVAALQERFGRHLVPVHLPIGSETSLAGVINVLDSNSDVPAEYESEFEEARERLIEAIAEIDDDLATKYLEGEEITQEEMLGGVKQGLIEGTLVPILAGSPLKGIGVTEFMDFAAAYLPSPADSPAVSARVPGSDETSEIECDNNGPLAALVFKTAADPFVGKLSYFRVYSGTFQSDSQLQNANRGEGERIGQVFEIRGREQDAVPELAAGDIGAVTKLNSVLTGDTISSRETATDTRRRGVPIAGIHDGRLSEDQGRRGQDDVFAVPNRRGRPVHRPDPPTRYKRDDNGRPGGHSPGHCAREDATQVRRRDGA